MSRIGFHGRRISFPARLVVIVLLCLLQKAGASSPPKPGNLGAPGAPPRSPNGNAASQTLIVSGDVVREDGSPPPFGAVVDCDCGQGSKREIEVDVSGHFSFQISRMDPASGTSSPFNDEDGSMWTPRGKPVSLEVNFCDLRARLPGYRSSVIRVTADPSANRIDVPKVVLRPDQKTQGSTVSLTGLKAPKSARKAMERAQRAIEKTDLESALKSLKKALDVYPRYAEAWYQIGLIEQRRQRYRDSQSAFERAVAADPDYVPPFLGLATLAWYQQQWQEMLAWSDRVLKLDPLGFPEAYFLNSLAFFKLDNLDAAELMARKEQQLDTAHRLARIHLLLSDILFGKGDITGSVQELRSYLQLAPAAFDAPRIRELLLEREKQNR